MKEQEFINKLAPIAVKDMKESGILASVTLAQSALESGFGTTDLAIHANNLGGMKCDLSGNTWKSAWDGASKYYKNTKEQRKDGTWYTVRAAFRLYPNWSTYIKDHSLYLLGAMKDKNKKRFAGLVGEKDTRKAIQIIKDGGYATDLKYVDKVMSIITKYNLTQYDQESSIEEDRSVKIESRLAVKNKCYRNGKNITPKGLMLHSVGCPQPNPLPFVSNWNSEKTSVCVHLVIGKDPVVYQLLPFDVKANHCGSGNSGSGNNTLISLEMTEPSTIKYTSGANWIELSDGSNTKAHVLATYKNAVEVFAQICKQYGFNPLYSDVVMSHHEGNTKGIASNHGDVEHLWNKFGLTMNQFRQDVKKAMEGLKVDTVPDASLPVKNDTSAQKVNTLKGNVKVIYQGADGLNIRKAPSYTADVDHAVYNGEFIVTGISEDEKWYRLQSGLFITAIPDYVMFSATIEQKASTVGTGYYRVMKNRNDKKTQIGAFKDKNNAINLCKNNAGYRVYDDSGKEIYPLNQKIPENKEFKVRVSIPNLRIRKGPGTTYDYHKENGRALYTGIGEFTIAETKDGPGARLWGLLKSYADGKDGWISLDETIILN